MSIEYDLYLTQHKDNVRKAYDWIKEHAEELVNSINPCDWQVREGHDDSKSDASEYDAYDAYFYGGNRSADVVQKFRVAWLRHIHRNPHHWQFWILINDDPNEGTILLDMPYNYILEMVCDWWSFSWKSGDLYGIFSWWDEHKAYIQLHARTRGTVESVLEIIKTKLDELGTGGDD